MNSKQYFDIKKSALLVIDMQKYFTEEKSHAFVPKSSQIKTNILELQNLFLQNKRPIVLTQHINTKTNANMMAKWWKDLITVKNPGHKLDDDILKSKTIIKKSQYDAFYKTKLETLLKNKKVSQVVITGVLTHLCCETTARSAFVRGFEVFFITDATASYNEELHNASILNLSHGFAIPVSSKDLLCTNK